MWKDGVWNHDQVHMTGIMPGSPRSEAKGEAEVGVSENMVGDVFLKVG